VPTTAPVPGPSTTAPAPEARGSLTGRTIVIDPGHNGGNAGHPAEINRLVDAVTVRKPCDTVGAETASGYSEAAFNLDVSLRLRALLELGGAKVVMTRSDNNGVGPCITERAAIGNAAHADAAISIHADGGPPGGRGFHVIEPVVIAGHTEAIVGPSHRLALDLRDHYGVGSGLPRSTYAGHDGLDDRNDLGGLNLSTVPKVFIECGNLRNPTDAGMLESPSFRQRAAEAIAAGFSGFLSGR
jgi:N-acetylmuramoyl-L-alanine amidase